METNTKIVAALAFILTAWYLVEFFLFAYHFKKNDNALWRSIGTPESFGINGQLTYLSIVWGRKSIPETVKHSYRLKFLRLRVLFIAAIVSYLILT